MPPLYDQKCLDCGVEFTTLRSFKEFDQGPTKEELIEEQKPALCSGDKEHRWERQVGNTSIKRSWAWGSKGNM